MPCVVARGLLLAMFRSHHFPFPWIEQYKETSEARNDPTRDKMTGLRERALAYCRGAAGVRWDDSAGAFAERINNLFLSLFNLTLTSASLPTFLTYILVLLLSNNK